MGYGVADTGVDFDFVTPLEAHALLKSNQAVFVDSRDTDDFKLGHIQTAYSFPANDIMFKPDKLDKSLVQRCVTLTKAGKLVVVVSDAGITGMKNRGHVSRCRHVAQYLVELGVERQGVRRLARGLNGWKALGLDGIIGDNRMYYAGSVVARDKVQELAGGEEEAQALEQDAACLAVADEPAPKFGETGDEVVPAPALPSSAIPGQRAPAMVDSPTVYRVIRGEIFKKAAPEVEKIISFQWPVDRLVRTTGQLFVGASGGKWAELDVSCGEKKGWVYVVGPGFGPSTRKIITEFMVV